MRSGSDFQVSSDNPAASTVPSPTLTPPAAEGQQPSLLGWASGESCRRQGEAMASTLVEWGIQGDLGEAAVLLPAFMNQSTDVESTAHQEGPIAELCRAYVVGLEAFSPPFHRGTREAHMLVRLFIASYQDPRLSMLAAAHLWQAFTAIKGTPSLLGTGGLDREIRQVMLPFYGMLGLWGRRLEVADWLVQNGVERERYRRLGEVLARAEPMRCQAFEQIADTLAPRLAQAEIKRSQRSPLRISRTVSHEDGLHPEQFDRLRVEVVVGDREACYQALGWIHQLWRPQEGGTLDYISAPNLNGYRSLHTTVAIPVNTRLVRGDFRIFTPEMERINTWGVATLFQDGATATDMPGSWWEPRGRASGCQRIAAADPGSLPSTLFAFTPQGQLVEFPREATVVDYAYSVHSEVASQTAEFRINGEVVEPTAILRHLDLVELVQDPSATGPTRVWLSAAHTSRARTKIDRHLKLHGGRAVEGRNILNDKVHELEEHYGMQFPRYRLEHRLQDVAQRMKLGGTDDLLGEIAARRILPERLLHPLFCEELANYLRLPESLWLRPFQITFAQCCRPRLADDIVGSIRVRHGAVTALRVHNADCPQRPADKPTMALAWRVIPAGRETYTIDLDAPDDKGLLGWVLEQVYQESPHANVLENHATSRYGKAHISMIVEIDEKTALDHILAALKGRERYSIESLHCLSLSPSEVSDLAAATRAHTYNPYGRLPVTNREMFFGRKKELKRLLEWIQVGAGIITLTGVKRVGKTTLIRQLQRHFLDVQTTAPVYLDFQVRCADEAACAYETACALHDALAGDQHTWQLGYPVREAFLERPVASFVEFLRKVQDYVAPRRLVLLIDEFSRAFETSIADDRLRQLLDQWQHIVHATTPEICYVFVVHKRALESLNEARDEGLRTLWAHFAATGESMMLHPFAAEEARQLILSPVRNVLEYDEDAVEHLLRLTGGSPYLIHVLCGELVREATDQRLPVVSIDQVEDVAARYLNPQENLYRHLEEEIRGLSIPICLTLARLSGDRGEAIPWEVLERTLPDIPAGVLAKDLEHLRDARILDCADGEDWRFSSLLFSRWLAQKAV